MCIDLVNGHMDAYDFKLTGSRIHFNSHPEMYESNPLYEDESRYAGLVGYLMRIGHDGKIKVDYAESHLTAEELAERATPGYMMMDGDGNLTIRVNSLYLTESLGGVNLLQQTSPRQTIPLTTDSSTPENPLYQMDDQGNIMCTWDTREWKTTNSNTIVSGADEIGAKPYPVVVTGGDHSIYQIVEKPSKQGKYTLSGWVRSGANEAGTLTLSIENCQQNGILEDLRDEDGNLRLEVADSSALNENKIFVNFDETNWTYFEYTIKINSEVSFFKVSFIGTCDFYLWHAMFEQGSVATTWSPSPKDNENAVLNTKSIYDKYLNQDKIFNKLIKDPITGQDMVGIWLVPIEDEYGSRKELYINATYIATGILRSSNWDGTFKVETKPKVKLVEVPLTDENGNPVYDDNGNQKTTIEQVAVENEFISTYGIETEPTQGVYFNLNEGKMWAATFELDAWNNNAGLYLNSHPGVEESYFRIGDSSSWVRYYRSAANATTLSIAASNFTLTAGSGDNFLGLYSGNQGTNTTINTNTTNTWRIIAGTKFGVTADGSLYASSATITGNITATTLTATNSGTIGGWKIDSTSLKSADETAILNSDGTISGAAIYIPNATSPKFSVTSTGVLTAIGATMQSLTVKQSLLVTSGSASKTRSMKDQEIFDGGGGGGNSDTPTTSTALATIEGTTSITGSTSIGGNTTIEGTLTVGTTATNTSITINGTSSITGNTTIEGTLTVGTTANNTSVTINGNNTVTGNTSIDGNLTVPSGDHIYLATGGGDDGKSSITLLDYITANSDSLIDFSLFGADLTVVDLGSLFGKSTAAGALATTGGTVTVSAPPSVPTKAGLFLKSTGTTAATAWSSIAPSDISHTTDNNGQVLGVTDGSAKWLTLGALAYKDSITASLVNFSNTTVTADPDSGAGVYKISITDPVTIPTYSSVTVYLYTKTQPGGGYFQTSETTDSDDIPEGAYWTKITRNIVTSTTSTSDKTFTGKVKVSVSAT